MVQDLNKGKDVNLLQSKKARNVSVPDVTTTSVLLEKNLVSSIRMNKTLPNDQKKTSADVYNFIVSFERPKDFPFY